MTLNQPAEWEKHQAVWLAWPSHENLWGDTLIPVQKEFSALCRAICDFDSNSNRFMGEPIHLLVPHEKAKSEAQRSLEGLPITYHLIPFGDIWLRDTAPIFLRDQNEEISAHCFKFNGWGEKYILPFDGEVSQQIAKNSLLKTVNKNWILEGGSVETDGLGTCITTKQCLLNPNRNPNLTLEQIEKKLKSDLGFKKILWLQDGLLNDHTDGHIDTLVRFIDHKKVICMHSHGTNDPNHEALTQIINDLKRFKDANESPLEITEIPNPGTVLNSENEIMPASYVNFYISNSKVIVPTYGTKYDQQAVSMISKCFPTHDTVGLSAISLLEGGGSFHCITQQVPL